jgi:alpha-tubulin suppressor-like RCC1 family protein
LAAWLTAGDRLAGVACGDAHTCATLSSGRVLVWGSHESGQLGLGPSPHTGRLETAFWPTELPLFHGSVGCRVEGLVACGAAHCVAIDRGGDVWAWGGVGGACLGLPVDAQPGRARHTLRPTSELQAAR